MTEKEVIKLFKSEKALLTGHFLLSSGLHSPNYLQCALLLQKPWVAEKLCRALAGKFKKVKIDTVVGPALGGVIVSYEIGRALKKKSIFAERLPAGQAGVDGTLILRRGFGLKKDEKVLVVEDVITTAKSSNEVVALIKESGAKLVGVGSIVDRSGGSASFEVPFFSLLKIDVKSYEAADCPLCREGKVALVKPGSRTTAVLK